MARSTLVRITAFLAVCSASCGASTPPAATTGETASSDATATTTVTLAPTAAPTSSSTASAPSDTSTSTAFLPLVPGSRYEYKAVFRGRDLTTVTVLRQLPGLHKDLFYFVDDDKDKDNPLISSANIGEGVYSLRADGIYTGVATFLNDAQKVEPKSMQLLLALPPKVNAKATVMVDPDQNWRREFVVTGIETMKVPAGTFNGCVHITFTTLSNDEPETAQAWLAPGVGMVRWIRASGRVDELVSYEIPGKSAPHP